VNVLLTYQSLDQSRSCPQSLQPFTRLKILSSGTSYLTLHCTKCQRKVKHFEHGKLPHHANRSGHVMPSQACVPGGHKPRAYTRIHGRSARPSGKTLHKECNICRDQAVQEQTLALCALLCCLRSRSSITDTWHRRGVFLSGTLRLQFYIIVGYLRYDESCGVYPCGPVRGGRAAC
jgi:hypothetical protein